jgi:hypothetical protein
MSNNTDGTAESQEVVSVREDQREVIAGHGKDLRPDSKAAAKEKKGQLMILRLMVPFPPLAQEIENSEKLCPQGCKCCFAYRRW